MANTHRITKTTAGAGPRCKPVFPRARSCGRVLTDARAWCTPCPCPARPGWLASQPPPSCIVMPPPRSGGTHMRSRKACRRGRLITAGWGECRAGQDRGRWVTGCSSRAAGTAVHHACTPCVACTFLVPTQYATVQPESWHDVLKACRPHITCHLLPPANRSMPDSASSPPSVTKAATAA